MNKSPVTNAFIAALYIVVVATTMFYGSNYAPKEDTVLMPIAMLSLFTLSASVMGYLFVGTPLRLYLDGKKKEAVDFFFKTVGSFAVLTVIAVIISVVV